MRKFLFKHEVKPEKLDAYLEATLAMAAAGRAVSGVYQIDVLSQPDTPTVVHVLASYFHEGGRRAHQGSEGYLAWRKVIEDGGLLAADEVQAAVESLRPEDRAGQEFGSETRVTLRPVDADNIRAVLRLRVSEAQDDFVAPNVYSLAEAYAAGPAAWPRAIYADEVPVGFVMLSVNVEKPRYYLWRYMIDQRYQGLGFGRKALTLVIDHVRTLPNATELFLSYVPGEGSPKGFYEKLGFRDTGVVDEDELEMRLAL